MSDLHHQLKHYNIICLDPHLFCLYTSIHFILHMLAMPLVLLIDLLLKSYGKSLAIVFEYLCYV